jgi:hypothetical protein
MKNVISIIALMLVSSIMVAQTLKPYILASSISGEMPTATVKANLTEQGFTVIGEYMPADDDNRWLIVVSHPELDKAVQAVGGLTGFAATLRVALTKEENSVNITYTNPTYWGNAYFRDNYDKVAINYKAVDKAFKTAFATIGSTIGTPFGSEKGEKIEDLRKYHYMMGMPYFDDTKELGEFSSYKEAIDKIEASLASSKPGITKVYRYDVPGKDLTLYGLALGGENGETKFMPKIDITTPKHTAFLPYEILVMGNEVHMLHGRFRIALSFPDLTMGTFTKIMSTPGDIEDLMKEIVEE